MNSLQLEVTIEKIIERHIENEVKKHRLSADYPIEYFFLNDPRAIRKNINQLRNEKLSLGANFLNESLQGSGVLQQSMTRAFRESCAKFSYRSENIPPASSFFLKVIIKKINEVMDYLYNSSNVISQSWIESKYITQRGLADAICDCVFYSIFWKSDEVAPIIKSLLFANSFGTMTSYRMANIVRYIEQQGTSQPFSIFYDAKNNKRDYSWLRYTKFLRNQNRKLFSPEDTLYDKAKKIGDYRIPKTDALISSLINLIEPETTKDKIILRREPNIVDIAIIRKSEIEAESIRFTWSELMLCLKNYPYDLSLLRGLLAYSYPLSDKESIENILMQSNIVLKNKNGRKLGLKKDLDKIYRQSSFKELIECLPDEVLSNYNVCSSINFYYSLFRNRQVYLECKLQ